MSVVNIGSGTFLRSEEIMAIFMPETSQGKRILTRGLSEDKLYDVTGRRARKSIILTKEGSVFVSVLAPATIVRRIQPDDKENLTESDE